MFSRRDFLRISAMASAAALVNWQIPAWAQGGSTGGDNYDVIIIGAGLGGLSCAAWLVQYGFRPLVIDQRDKVGGYATSFQRGDFKCEVSLHGITGNPIYRGMVCQLLGVTEPELMSMLVPHEYSWNALYRDNLALDFPSGIPGGASGIQQMADMLLPMFPEESMQLSRYMADWEQLLFEIGQFYMQVPEAGMPPLDEFFRDYPLWARMVGKTLAEHMSGYGIRNPKLRSMLGQSWHYYGLPPSQLPAWFYLWGTGSYHNYGKFYIQGTSQSLSDILAGVIRRAGGDILLNTEAKEIIVENGRAVGVKTEEDNAYYGNAVVSNASVPQTFGRLLPESEVPNQYMEQITQYRPSVSHCNVWLGLNQDISSDIHQSNLFVYPHYDHEKAYKAAMRCKPSGAGIMMMNYDRLIKGVSPEGGSLISLQTLSGYRTWQRYEEKYFSGNKKGYYRRKKRIARKIIRMAEQTILPGLSDMIVMQESSTPLTNVRFTGNTGGAIYGFEQIRDNSGFKRVSNRTPVPGLYLSGAWTNPGGGYELVILSGKEAVKCIAEDWGII